ncbi:hypothetical protein O7626_26650 [Micromonospora sp. WMMD1102]|uniref:hypothetical protein n=1 Tax=Micromonospora sp. WMMD1102 TaxID=3016105 RepID=UPI0024152372|nr:hypothetical protein [Micromonospora sp. WMMD1102]MDG4789461.1 hypothetical protein [Micromonospora sp. WMMD1102]
MKHLRAARPRHRRAWWRCWLYCRCGHRWICPDSIASTPGPYRPTAPATSHTSPSPVYRDCWSTPRSTPVRLTSTEAAEILALADPPPPARPGNRRPRWDAPTNPHLNNGRAGNLTPAGNRTPAQQRRSRSGVRA